MPRGRPRPRRAAAPSAALQAGGRAPASKSPRILRLRLVGAALAAAALAPAVAGAQSADVAALQVALRAKGLYGGTVDGVRGPQTAAAVRSFQARRGLSVDGVPGP